MTTWPRTFVPKWIRLWCDKHGVRAALEVDRALVDLADSMVPPGLVLEPSAGRQFIDREVKMARVRLARQCGCSPESIDVEEAT